MRRTSRDRLLIGLLVGGATAVGCSRLTAPDWDLVVRETGGTGTGAADSGGSSTGGSPDEPLAGQAGETSGGEGGMGGANGGNAGKAGSGGGGRAGAGGGGTFGGGAGTAGGGGTAGLGGTAGAGGTGGMSGTAGTTGSAGAPPCTGTPGPIDDALVLFGGPRGTSGARGGRAGLDAACEAERVKLMLPQTTSHAFITISATDFIANWGPEGANLTNGQHLDLPVSRRVVGPTGIQIAPSFARLIQEGGIQQSLECAKVFTTGTEFWLSGNGRPQGGSTSCVPFTVGGTPAVCGWFGGAEDTCNAWTFGTSDTDVQARYGSTIFTDKRFFAFADRPRDRKKTCDIATDPILCLAYTP